MALKKTNAARLLDGLHIPYTVHSAPVDEQNLSALALAHNLGVPPEQVYKTLVIRAEKAAARSIFLVCIPGPAELDLKKAAQAVHHKHAALVPLKEVLPLTGYIRGGCSPLATKKPYPVLVDATAARWEAIYVSAGLRGTQLLVAPLDLLRATGGRYADLCRESD